MYSRKSSETGQALILLVLAVVGMLGFVALTIDGGMVYSDRRIAQNAADAASMAGAGQAAQLIKAAGSAMLAENWNCTVFNIGSAAWTATENAAIDRADKNDFEIDTDISDNHGVTTTCVDGSGKYVDVRVLITLETTTSFAHFVFGGAMVNTVEAVARVFPRTAAAEGNAIVSLVDTCGGTDKGTTFDGTSDVTVIGGGIFSNSCITKNGASGKVYTDSASYIDTYYDNGGTQPSIVTEPVSVTEPIEVDITPPDCSSLSNGGSVPSVGSISPGKYTNISINNNDVVTMEPGLYCVSGNFRINGGTVVGDGITIYLTGNSSSFSSSGTAIIQFKAPPVGCDYGDPVFPGCPPALGGLLIYMEKGSNQGISLLGASTSYYEGTVYAPNAMIEVGGAGNEISEFGAQLIGENIKVHGTSEIKIIYDDSLVYHNPVKLQMHR